MIVSKISPQITQITQIRVDTDRYFMSCVGVVSPAKTSSPSISTPSQRSKT
jgi:hypothetical protein